MTAPPVPPDESERLAALESLAILDTPPEIRFDRITRLARRMFDVPIALVSLVDEDRQWFKSSAGLDATETPRDVSFCGHAILRDDVMVVRDATRDDRFVDNPLVTGVPNIRFYAGYPLHDPTGHRIGTLCLIDHRTRDFDADARSALTDLGQMVEHEFAAHELANTDGLTGLRNRRGLEAAAAPILAAAGNLDLPVTLVFIDLDDFKQINDVHGHAAGDRALRDVAHSLVDVFRSSDVIARIGGDEFCILTVGVGAEDVQGPLSRLAEVVRTRNDDPATSFEIAYSTGVVTFHREATIADLLAEADRRMYRHKRRTGFDATQRELASMMLDLAGSLTDPAPRRDRLDKLCKQTVELTGCDRSSIMLWDGAFHRAAHNYGNPPEVAAMFDRFRVSPRDPLVVALFEARSCLVVNDVAASDLVDRETTRVAGIRSMAVAPLLAGHEKLGFMTAEYNERSGVFTDLDATILHGVARLVTGVLRAQPEADQPG